MKHLTVIQTEFVKEARKWDDLTYEDQKGYLKRHPKSKRKITARPGQSTGKSDDESSESTTSSSQTYQEFAQNLKDKFGDNAKLWANKKIEKLQEKIDRTQNSALRREQRAHGDLDGTALEAAYETNEPRLHEIEILKHFVSHGSNKLPKELQEKYDDVQQSKTRLMERKERRKEETEKHSDLMNKVVTWTSRKHFGQEFSGRVVAIKTGKHGPYVKTDTGWQVPVSMITKTKNISKEDRGKVQIEPEELVGKTVRWKTKYRPANPFRLFKRRRHFKPMRIKQEPPDFDSSTGTAGGQVTGTQGSKVIVGTWRIPLSLIKTVDNKEFSGWK